MPRTIAYRLWIDWDFNGVYTNESAYLIQATGDLQFAPPAEYLAAGKGIVDACTLELRNSSGRFSPMNSSGALYSAIQNGKAYHCPMYLEVSIDGGSNYYRVFTGVTKVPRESGLTVREGPTVTLECRSRDELLLQQRLSTPLATFQTWIDDGYNEAQIISAVLTQAGITTGTAIDPGTVAIPAAWWDDESALEDLWALAASCGGRLYSDPDGTVRYENAANWLAHTSSLETISRADYDRPLEAVYSDDDLYNVITVEAAPRVVGALDLLWEPDDPVVVPPSSTVNVTARLQQPAYEINAPSYVAAAAGGENLSAYVSVSATYYAQRVEMAITNSNTYWAAYMRSFKISGRPVVGGPEHEETRNSAAHGSNGAFFSTRGSRTRSIRNNPFVQQRSQAGMLALFLLHQSEYPRLQYVMRGVAGKPARRLGDRVTLSDSSVLGSNRDVFIVGINWRLTTNGYSQDLTAVDAAQLYPYQSTGYFVVGTDTLGASAKRVFY